MEKVKNHSVKYSIISNNFLVSTNTLMVFVFSVIFFSNLFFLFKIPLGYYSVFFASAVASVYAWFNLSCIFKDLKVSRYLLHIFIVTAILFSSVFLSSKLREYSSDGQTYHAQARIEFISGKNPFYDDFSDQRIQEFPNGHYVFANNIYQITGDIDSTRALNFIVACASFMACFSIILLLDCKLTTAFFVSLTATLNTIVITQVFSFYVDGILASLINIIVFQSLIIHQKHDKFLLIAFGATVAVLISIKLTGILYALILIGGVIGWDVLQQLKWQKIKKKLNTPLQEERYKVGVQPRHSPQAVENYIPSDLRRERTSDLIAGIKEQKSIAFVVCIAVIIGIGFFGFSSYVKTLWKHGDLLHVYGESVENYFRSHPENIPSNWINESPPKRLVLSLLSISKQSGNEDAKIKIPFTLNAKEVKTFHTGDNRSGGFGPLFSGAFLISLFLMFNLVYNISDANNLEKQIFLSIVLISATVIINPMAWQARFAPQLWLVTVFALFYSLQISKKSFIVKIFSLILLTALTTNISIVGYSYITQQYKATRKINRELNKIVAMEMTPKIFFRNRIVFKAYLDEIEKIQNRPTYKRVFVITDIGCKEPYKFPFTDNEVLLCNQEK
jgi:hypothetical protein